MRPLVLLAVLATTAAAAPVIAPDSYGELRWRMVGPFRGGRTRAVTGAPGRPHTFYMAPVNGGVWRTDDAGRTWSPIFDDQPTQSIGALAVAPSNPDVVYAASGEGLMRPDLSVGDGVYRSRDGGKTWKHVGLADAQQIPQLAIDPKDPNRVFAAVLGHPFGANEQRGVFRTLDGGATWQRVLYIDPSIGANSIAIDPVHPDIVYAGLWQARLGPWEDDNEYERAGGGLYKSSDGGKTWKKLAGGLPANTVEVNVALAPSRPSRLYAALSTTDRSSYGHSKGNALYRSDDAGATWTAITTDDRPLMKIGGGDLMVPVVDPQKPDVVYVASIVAMKSSDGGKTWTWLRGAPGGDDYQNLWVNPSDPLTIALVSDQGAAITLDGGASWSSWYNQPTAQLYHVGVTADVPYRVCSGQQESGSVCIASRSDDGSIGYRDWHPVGASEYGYVVPDPRDTDVVYGAGRNHVSRYRRSTAQVQDVTPIPVRGAHRVERTQPLVFSPVQPDLLYYASEALFATRDGGRTWKRLSGDLAHPSPGIPPSVGDKLARASDEHAAEHRGAIYAIAPSRKSATTIWVGTDDGKLWRTTDTGAHWRDITPPELTAWSKVTQLDASHFDDSTAYASVSRLRVDDLAPYIYKTHDGGATWTAIVGGLPSGPVDAVREDPVRRGLLYAATENGVHVSFDDGEHWQSLQQNLPHTSVRDLVVHGDDIVVATHGRGFWILDDVALLRQLAPAMSDTLFTPTPAIRFARSSYPDTPVPPDEPYADNPPDGAIVDYYLHAPATRVTLDILDAAGGVVRHYASDDAIEPSDAEIRAQLIPAWWLAPRTHLATGAGMHRWTWDLRGAPPRASQYSYPISAAPHATPRLPLGPRVAPGTYAARLVIDGKALPTTRLEVRLDPRVKLPDRELEALHRAEVELAELLAKSSDLVLTARAIEEQLEAAAQLAAKHKELAAPLAEARAAVSALLEDGKQQSVGEPPPTLTSVNGEIGSLYGAIGVDAAPTTSQLSASAKARTTLDALTKRWDATRSGPLARLDAALAAAGAARLRYDQRPTVHAGADED
jgi:photosystem II stability/assembly factor-like uncharacterized protein